MRNDHTTRRETCRRAQITFLHSGPEKETSRKEHHQTERSLPHHHEVTPGEKSIPSSRDRRVARLRFEIVDQICPGRAQRRAETEEKRRDEAKSERRSHDHEVRLQMGSQREVERGKLRDEKILEKGVGPQTEQETQCATDHSEDDSFDQELAHDLTASRA